MSRFNVEFHCEIGDKVWIITGGGSGDCDSCFVETGNCRSTGRCRNVSPEKPVEVIVTKLMYQLTDKQPSIFIYAGQFYQCGVEVFATKELAEAQIALSQKQAESN